MRTNHHLLLVVLCMMLSISAKGQFFYPYNPYLNQQPSCMAWIGSSIANDKLAEAEE